MPKLTHCAYLRERNNFYQQIRQFFQARDVLEVETPTLSQHTITDVFIDSFQTTYFNNDTKTPYFLQTSPEFHMKRLLANNSGSIFQICKAFRNQGEFGHMHNPEFTLLEWYRVDFDHHDLMQEVSDLLVFLLNCAPATKISYQLLFENHLNIQPHTCDVNALKTIAEKNNLHIDATHLSKDDWLQLLLSHLIEPHLGFHAPVFIYDYPATQAALAKIRQDQFNVAERFEVYINGQEIGNGFHELTDPLLQLQRFQADQNTRRQQNRFVPEIDGRFMKALESGLPQCAGIAMGLDRLFMLKMGVETIREVLPFAWDEA